MSQSIKFGTIAGQFEIQIMEEGSRKILFLQGYSKKSIPVSWGLDDGVVLTEDDLEELRNMLEPATRKFDKKVSEIVGHFMTKHRG